VYVTKKDSFGGVMGRTKFFSLKKYFIFVS
jgi:hypothetical protein